MTAEPGHAPRNPGRAFALALGLVALITPLAVHLFFPVIPEVKVALGLTHAEAQLTFSVALFGMAFATLFYGTLSDRYGRRPVLLSGLALFLIGSVVSALAQSPPTLLLGRLVQAVGAGCALTLVRAIARDAYRADQLVKAIAYLTMFGTLGPMVSPTIAGVLIDTLGWRSTFGFAVLAGGTIAFIAYRVLYETHSAASRTAKGDSVIQGYRELFSRIRFNAFVLQSGFNTGAFIVMATAAASLMTELLHQPATAF
jgi:DHA1 family bicyclomycin/chloramphenicol resistance-like MFS transporter